MFESVRKNQRLYLGLILLLLLPGFVFFGIQGYERMLGPGSDVAKVGGITITRPQFDQALQQQIDQLRQQMGDAFDARLLDSPAARRQVLDTLVTRAALLNEADARRVLATDADVRELVSSIDAFHDKDGRFDAETYRRLLASRGMTPESFEMQVRDDVRIQKLVDAARTTEIVPATVAANVAAIEAEQRTVRVARFEARAFEAGIKPDDAQVQAWYDANKARFTVPEQLDVQYVVLDRDAMAAKIEVSDEDARKAFEATRASYVAPEQRRARHILVAADASAGQDAQDAARAHAQQLLERLRADPSAFAAVAAAESKDAGSAGQGGDLGWFARDTLDKALTDAAFATAKGELAPLVHTEFGWHVLQVTDAKGGGEAAFDDVRERVVAQVRQRKAEQAFLDAAEKFTNTVYEQPDSLEPAARAFGLSVENASGVTRAGVQAPATVPQPLPPVLRQPRLVEALFAPESLGSRRNTAAVEAGSGQLVSARVTQVRPAREQPLDEVRDRAVGAATLELAQKKAREAGEAALAAARAGGTLPESTGTPETVSRRAPGGLEPRIAQAAFRMAAQPVPAYQGVDLGADGYALVVLDAVTAADPAQAGRGAEFDRLRGQLAQLSQSSSAGLYLAGLRARTPVSVGNVPAPAARGDGEP